MYQDLEGAIDETLSCLDVTVSESQQKENGLLLCEDFISSPSLMQNSCVHTLDLAVSAMLAAMAVKSCVSESRCWQTAATWVCVEILCTVFL